MRVSHSSSDIDGEKVEAVEVSQAVTTKLDTGAVRELDEFLATCVASGSFPSYSYAIACDGKILHEGAHGPDGAGSFVMFSVTKAFVAGLAWLALDRGAIALTDSVSSFVPAFSGEGRDAVKIGHLLDHTGGFPSAPMRFEQAVSSDLRMQRYATWRLTTAPGTTYAYHATSAFWLLAEVLLQAGGAPIRDLLKSEISGPLGLDVGIGSELTATARGPAKLELVGQATDPTVIKALAAQGIDVEAAVGEAGPVRLLRFNEPDILGIGVPGAGGVGTAASVARYYQELLHNTSGLWSQAVLAAGTRDIRVTLADPHLGMPANRTLGLVVAGDDGLGALRGFGQANSAAAFGHPGVGGQIAWADPESGLSFAFLTNGIDRDLVAQAQRATQISTLAAHCGSASG